MALYNMPKMDDHFLCNFLLTYGARSAMIKVTQGSTYEEGEVDHELKAFNWITSGFQSPDFPSYALAKWSNKSRRKILTHMTLQFFTFSPAIYSTYTCSARQKSSRVFSCTRVWIRPSGFSPSNMCLYMIAAGVAQDRRGGLNRPRA